ncbi:MAG: 50S ribosomal protein L32 [Minisyncoccia bacterium]
MSVRMRHTKGHTGNRRSHHALKAMRLVKSENGSLSLPHRLDETTGTYRGRLIAAPKVKANKEQRAKNKKLSEKEHEQVHKLERAEEQKSAGSKGIIGKIAAAARPKARSGAGGGGV